MYTLNYMTKHQPVIQVTSLVKSFGDVQAVKGITFDVEPGEIFAFLGPNGAGKSTTIKMLTTLLAPTSGTLKLAGHDITHDQAAVRKSFGIVFQDPSVDNDLTAYENMQLHASMYGISRSAFAQRAKELMTLVELWDRRDSLVKTYSGGMKRRLEIARGLLHHPHILFLDEPTLGLDTQTRNLLWNYVRSLNEKENMTVFFSTHYLEEAEQIADRIAMIDHGEIVALGTVDELKKQTNTTSLEEAYLALTGKAIRDEKASDNESMRMHVRARRG